MYHADPPRSRTKLTCEIGNTFPDANWSSKKKEICLHNPTIFFAEQPEKLEQQTSRTFLIPEEASPANLTVLEDGQEGSSQANVGLI